ncbi:hypothetical protein LCX93_02190 [Sulfurimonas sp. SWIR-19]|uniref:hypothetical protein n=1 Tax=Sulfurimonas sp. SWIR-19 TaxID=2878390 RepID=UPI001CF3471F|nr:hypothetical protein [Sulfurimonas sp. SWIR-19]UCN00745.1 hypothetical protein LCX93_02190 [Sulfurimonas sp. SWIR-19]
MATQETKRYMEMQMQELKEACAVNEEEENPAPKKANNNKNKNAEIAKLYEDAAEYEEDLKSFEEELAIVNAHAFKEIPELLKEKFSTQERDYAQEIRTLLEATWTHYVDVEKTHPQEQLEIIKTTPLNEIVPALTQAFPDYEGDFESDIKEILVKRWQMLIAIKKEHIKEEIAEIKILGLKPNYVQRIYKQFHGIE